MMKKILVSSLLSLILSIAIQAQDSTGTGPLATARKYSLNGDYNNALVVLNKALEKDNSNLDLKKELAFTYYLERDYAKALEIAKPLAEDRNADVRAFQILGMIFNATDEVKMADRMYRDALKKFPESGALWNEYGEVQWSRKNFAEAAKQWEKGVEEAPNYSGNYYNLARYYFFSEDKVWGLLYGEVFVNLESFSKRTPEIKTLLLEGYKKLFRETDIANKQQVKNDFINAYLTVIKDKSDLVSTGVSPASLSALRTSFLLDWFAKNATKFPFRLFEYQQQLARSGLFEAYNQWIFGAAADLSAFQQWTANNNEAYSRFTTLQKSRVFKLPGGQYYHSGK
ncbi:MAG TPA: tetratricopeptide repeat protein [Flavitalea sp.]|nr:tetratricopeptide repeat protein [Flavitalea sp.]